MKFWLGTHKPHWVALADVPLFISRNAFFNAGRPRRTMPRATCEWALDSGGFTELADHGRWRISISEYVEFVQRCQDEVGMLAWAAPMDWMCEEQIVAGGELPGGRRAPGTGLTVREHQERTVQNFLDLRGHGPFIPVLQGQALSDYEDCVGLYEDAGVDLRDEPLVGVGSVCRRQASGDIARLMLRLHDYGLQLHGFGVKKDGLAMYAPLLASADSLAWSFRARRGDPLPGCHHGTDGKGKCNACIRFAMKWRAELLARVDDRHAGRLQPALFDSPTIK